MVHEIVRAVGAEKAVPCALTSNREETCTVLCAALAAAIEGRDEEVGRAARRALCEDLNERRNP